MADPDDSVTSNGVDLNGQVEDEILDKEQSDDEEKEYEAIDVELNQLNTCLDKLETWNDSLQGRLKDLLENMQQTREEGAQAQNSSDKESQKSANDN